MMSIVWKEELEFLVGMRVRAVAWIVDGPDGTPDPNAARAQPGWTYARPGDTGTVEHVNEHGDPTVRFDRTGTASICSPWELDIIPTAVAPDLPFPQADDAERMMHVVDAVVGGHGTVAQLARHFGFDERQSHYYGKAASYLGLLRPVRGGYEPTVDALRFVRVSADTRKAMICGAMLDLPVFREAVGHVACTGVPPSGEQVIAWLAKHTDLNATTRRRRAGTVLAWCEWLADDAGPPAAVA